MEGETRVGGCKSKVRRRALAAKALVVAKWKPN